MGQLLKIVEASEDQDFESTTREADEVLWFDTIGAGKRYVIEIIGDVQTAGSGGGSLALYHDTDSGEDTDATGGFDIQVDNGAWVRRNSLSNAVTNSGLSNAVHHVHIVGVIYQGQENGRIGVEFGLGAQPGGASLTRMPGMFMRVTLESPEFS
jgi:hypothetical protein